jgi:hypothetical protein
MKNKSDQFLHYFLKLKATVENYFSQEISTVYSNGCEDQKQKTLFATFGITHLLTQPQAPQHKGAAKSQHHRIVEIGLTLLHQVFMPVFRFSNNSISSQTVAFITLRNEISF